MENFNAIKNEKFNVGKIQKQRINITHKKGKALKQKDIKEIVKKINAKYIRDKDKTPKIAVIKKAQIVSGRRVIFIPTVRRLMMVTIQLRLPNNEDKMKIDIDTNHNVIPAPEPGMAFGNADKGG